MMTQTPLNNLNPNGFLRLKDVLKLFPVSKSTWWLGIEKGRFPKAVKLSSRITAWRVSDIEELLASVARQNELYAGDSACDSSTPDGLNTKNNN